MDDMTAPGESGMDVSSLLYPALMSATAKWAFTTRRVVRADVAGLQSDVGSVRAGDLVFGEIIKIGQHKSIQLAQGRASQAYPGDLVVLACGDRYAPDQFEAVAELNPEGSDLIAAGGLIGRMRKAHAAMAAPTQVRPLGLLTDQAGAVINVGNYALPLRPAPQGLTVLGVVGASMNAGKTTAAASLAHGLMRAGHPVAAIKATGTGAFGDFNAFLDAGIAHVSDFTDAGMASTYRQPIERIERGFESLLAHVAERGARVVVVELADGVFQEETAKLLEASRIRDAFAGLLFAAPDALGAVGGAAILRTWGLEPFAVSGMVSCSPLGSSEAQSMIGAPVVSRDELRDPRRAIELVSGVIRAALPARRTTHGGWARAA